MIVVKRHALLLIIKSPDGRRNDQNNFMNCGKYLRIYSHFQAAQQSKLLNKCIFKEVASFVYVCLCVCVWLRDQSQLHEWCISPYDWPIKDEMPLVNNNNNI